MNVRTTGRVPVNPHNFASHVFYSYSSTSPRPLPFSHCPTGIRSPYHRLQHRDHLFVAHELLISGSAWDFWVFSTCCFQTSQCSRSAPRYDWALLFSASIHSHTVRSAEGSCFFAADVRYVFDQSEFGHVSRRTFTVCGWSDFQHSANFCVELCADVDAVGFRVPRCSISKRR